MVVKNGGAAGQDRRDMYLPVLGDDRIACRVQTFLATVILPNHRPRGPVLALLTYCAPHLGVELKSMN